MTAILFRPRYGQLIQYMFISYHRIILIPLSGYLYDPEQKLIVVV